MARSGRLQDLGYFAVGVEFGASDFCVLGLRGFRCKGLTFSSLHDLGCMERHKVLDGIAFLDHAEKNR